MPRQAKQYHLTYKVRGTWPFPTDMLRYDESVAATDEDARIIALLSTEHATDAVFDGKRFRLYTVTLCHRGADRFWQPTERRWDSFLWRVVRIGLRDVA